MNWLQEHFTIVEGFPRPNWETINDSIIKNCHDTERNDLWCKIVDTWVNNITSVLSSNYSIFTSTNFLLLTSEDSEYTRILLEFLENTLQRILRALKGIALDEGYGPHVVIIFDNLDLYYSYISYYYPDEGEFASSGGVYLNKGYGHFVFPRQEIWQAESVAAHELCHALLDHLPIPLWLNEGITVNIENMIMGSSAKLMAHEMVKEHEEFWDEMKIQEFWSGRSFSRPDEGQHLSYHLAQFLVRTLSKDYNSFREFTCNAECTDGGESAANDVYGNSLGFLIEQLLGNGDWAPKKSKFEDNYSNRP